MKKLFTAVMCIMCTAGSFGQTTGEKVAQLLNAYAQLNQLNGTVLVSHKGKIVHHQGYGWKNAEQGSPATTATIYQVGSVTKQFTAAIILKLAEQKKLTLNDKLSKYFPAYPQGDSITIFHLLTHTSGIFNYTNDPEFMATKAVQPITEQQMLERFIHKEPDFSPGAKWSYSNSGYYLLGRIIQQVTRQPYEKIVRQYIFTPLGMNKSGFNFTGLADTNRAIGYYSISPKNSLPAGIVDSTVSYSAGAIYSTTTDLLKWHNGMLNNRVISAASKKKAFTPFKMKYGLGWFIDSFANKRVTMHGGTIFGFNALLVRVEQDNTCIVILNNTGNPKLDEMSKNLLAILYNKPYKVPAGKKEITLSEQILKRYVGTYELTPEFLIAITLENGKLFGQATAQPKFELFAQKEHYFFLKAVEAEVEFNVNATGEAESLVLYQGGTKALAKKIK